MVLTEEAAVMEPAVGLGCILGSAGEEDKEKQQHYIRERKYTSSTAVSQQSATGKTEEEEEEEEEEHSGHVSCFSKGHTPLLDKMAFKKIYNWI